MDRRLKRECEDTIFSLLRMFEDDLNVDIPSDIHRDISSMLLCVYESSIDNSLSNDSQTHVRVKSNNPLSTPLVTSSNQAIFDHGLSMRNLDRTNIECSVDGIKRYFNGNIIPKGYIKDVSTSLNIDDLYNSYINLKNDFTNYRIPKIYSIISYTQEEKTFPKDYMILGYIPNSAISPKGPKRIKKIVLLPLDNTKGLATGIAYFVNSLKKGYCKIVSEPK